MEKSVNDFVTLNSGYDLPKIGLGTSYYEKDEKFIMQALEVGYKHIDTASYYKSEQIIGSAIK